MKSYLIKESTIKNQLSLRVIKIVKGYIFREWKKLTMKIKYSPQFSHLFYVFMIICLLSLNLSAARSVFAQGGDGIKRQYDPVSGKVSFISSESGRPLAASEVLGIAPGTRLVDPALAIAQRFAPEFGVKDPLHELAAMRTNHSGNGRVMVRYQQNYQGVPVIGGELIVNTDENGDLYSMNGEVSSDISLITETTIHPDKARQIALQSVAKWYKKTPDDFVVTDPILWIFDESLLRPSQRPAELVWRMEVKPADPFVPIRELVLVNARRGNISLHFNQIDTEWAISQSAQLTNAQTQIIPKRQAALVSGGLRKTYTASHGTTLPGQLLCTETKVSCTNGSIPDADKAHTYAAETWNFYNDHHGRNSIDNQGMTIISTVQYDVNFQNAFWDGTQMVYGDGMVADDIVGHELTHGVTQNESNLFYYYQSGAINESFSDVWGELIDQSNTSGNDSLAVKWQIGEDSPVGAFRSMSDPTLFSDPDSITSPNYDTDPLFIDNGGVHHNSGINNKAAYLMVAGGLFGGKTVTALGRDKTLAIYYEAQTNLLTSGADYADLYKALYQACLNLVGGAQGITAADCQEVRDATDAVAMNAQPASDPNFNTDAPFCPSGQVMQTVFYDDIESGSSNWQFGATIGSTRWQVDSPDGSFAHSGQHSLYATDLPEIVADTYARLKSAVAIPTGSYLHFSQAFGFEDYFFLGTFDGGLLEYSKNGGSTWLDAGPLFVNNGYNGTIDPNYDNPLKGRAAFVGDSHGYISSRVNLNSLANNNVLFRWRMGLDSGGFDFGWWLDDVRIYKCFTPTILQADFRSVGANDGWVRESNETSSLGGAINSTGAVFFLGDSANNSQYRSILHFDTAALPDNAVVTKVTLKMKKQSLIGTDPFTTHKKIAVDIKKGVYSNNSALQSSDFESAANKNAVGLIANNPEIGGWYFANLNATAYPFINLMGTTQFRLRFQKDDNDDLSADYLKFFSGNTATPADRPVLIVEYYVL
jgi:Zn-dependent metalloprotease